MSAAISRVTELLDSSRRKTEDVQVKRGSKRPPYTVCMSTTTFIDFLLTIFSSMKCSIAEQGLGPVVGWNGATLVEEEDEMYQS
jgi:hypothetical protein